MALIFHSGFETDDFAEWPFTAGDVTVQGVTKKTGNYAAHLDSLDGVAATINSGNTPTRISVWIYIDQDDSNGVSVIGTTTLSVKCYKSVGDSSTIRLYDGANAKDSSVGAIPWFAWHRLSVSFDPTNDNAKVFVDGVEKIDCNDANVSTSIVGQLTADGDAGGGANGKDFYFDDYVEDDTESTDDLGDIRVAAASPSGVGSANAYDTSSGWGNVDELPANDADFIEDNQGNPARESYAIPDLDDLAGASAGDTINAVSLWNRGDRDGGGATDHMGSLRDNGAYYNTANYAFDSIAWFNTYYAVMPDDNGAWTEARFNALEIGAYHDGGQDQRQHCIVLMVAYTPAAGPVAHEKELSDAVAIADALSKAVGSTKADAVALVDDAGKGPAKFPSDSVALADSLTKLPGKGIADTLGIADAFTRVADYELPLADTVAITDAPGKTVVKTIADIMGIVDAILVERGLVKTLSDTVAIVDALIKTMSLGEADTVAIVDALIKTVELEKDDAVAIVEAVVKTVSIVEADTVTVTDSPSKLPGLIKADAVAITEGLTKLFGLIKVDAIAVTEGLTKLPGVIKADAVAITDGLTKLPGLIKTDTVAITDGLTKLVGVIKADVLAIADVCVKVLGGGVAHVKNLADTMAITDSASVYIVKFVNLVVRIFNRAITPQIRAVDMTVKLHSDELVLRTHATDMILKIHNRNLLTVVRQVNG